MVLKLSTTGELGGGLGRVGSAAKAAGDAVDGVRDSTGKAGHAFLEFSASAGDALASVASRAIDVGLSIAKWGGAAVMGVAAYGVAKLNNELEQTTISLAAISTAQGFTKDFAGGMSLAGDELAKMKQDVKSLPGDLGQLSDIMKTIATPAAQAGASMDQIRQLSGKTMLTSAILGVPQEVAAREMAQLLAGRSGAHNILGTRLGLVGGAAKEFNAESPEDRLKRINAEMAKYQGAADRFGNSFVANWTTLKDNIKYVLLAPGTSPLFDRVKQTMADINRYFDDHKAKIDWMVQSVGNKLANAWSSVVAEAKRLEPILEKFAALVERIDPGKALGTASHIGAGLLAAKVGGSAISMASGAAGKIAGSGIFEGLIGGATEAGEAAEVAGPALTTLGLVALPALAVGAAAAAGAVHALTDVTSGSHKEAMIAVTATARDAAIAGKNLERDMHPIGEMFDKLGVLAIKAADDLAIMAEGFHEFFQGWHAVDKTKPDLGPVIDHDLDLHLLRSSAALAGIGVDPERGKTKPLPPISVKAEVTINVQSNGDPTRLAHLVKFEIQKQAYKTMSPHVPNYGSHG